MIFLSFQAVAQKNGSNFTNEEVKQTLNLHNKYRNKVGTANLQWSNDLATSAQAWANHLAKKGCRMQHSNTEFGENIYWTTADIRCKDAVNSWGSEKKYYHGQKISYSNYTKVGHYTQMVWYNTTEVGCAYAKCKSGNTIFVCQYNPSGNYVGEKPYK